MQWVVLLFVFISISTASESPEKTQAIRDCLKQRHQDYLDLKAVCYIDYYSDEKGETIERHVINNPCMMEVYEKYGYFTDVRNYRKVENQRDCLCQYCRENPESYCERPGEYAFKDRFHIHDTGKPKCDEFVCNGSAGKPLGHMCFREKYEEHLKQTGQS